MKKVFAVVFLVSFAINVYAFNINDPAPSFKLDKLDSGAESLNALLGDESSRNIVILSFFDTQCKPCLNEIPLLQEIYLKYEGKGVKVRLVSIDPKGKEEVAPYIQEHKFKIPVLLDPYGIRLAKWFKVVENNRATVPQLFVIGKNGTIKKHFDGYDPKLVEELESLITELKKEAVVQTPKIEKAKNEITLLYTNSTNGHLESCECPENPFGGLLRRATFLKEFRKENTSYILVDSGDFFSAREDELKAKYVSKAFNLLKYDVMVPGDQELILGTDFIVKEAQTNNLPLVAANFEVCTLTNCRPLGKSYIIKEIGKYKVAVIGIVSPKAFTFFPKAIKENLKFSDPKERISEILQEIKGKVNLTILVTHAGYDEDRKLAENIDGIDVIVGGHSQTLLKQPEKIKNVLLVQAGQNGQYIGKLIFTLDNLGKVISTSNELVALVKNIPDDAEIKTLITEYKKAVEEENKKLLLK
ncbi:MAG: redoxin domain-containing protein [Candidatus Firestonebacteria bacterium]